MKKDEKILKNVQKFLVNWSEEKDGKRVLFFLTIARLDHVNMNMSVHWIESSESEMGGKKTNGMQIFFVS